MSWDGRLRQDVAKFEPVERRGKKKRGEKKKKGGGGKREKKRGKSRGRLSTCIVHVRTKTITRGFGCVDKPIMICIRDLVETRYWKRTLDWIMHCDWRIICLALRLESVFRAVSVYGHHRQWPLQLIKESRKYGNDK